MRKVVLIAAALSVGAVGVSQITAAQERVVPWYLREEPDENLEQAPGKTQANPEEMKVTGLVTKADGAVGVSQITAARERVLPWYLREEPDENLEQAPGKLRPTPRR
jgi:hypothetical protein